MEQLSFPRILAVIACILLAVAGWMAFRPVKLPEPRSALHAKADEWILPDLGKPSEEALSALAVRSMLIWPSVKPVDEKPLTAPNWRIVGIVSKGKESYAMLAVDGQPLQQLGVGDKLPGGAKIVALDADGITILLNGKRRILATYRE